MLHIDKTYIRISKASQAMRSVVELASAGWANHHKYVQHPARWYKETRQWLQQHDIKPGSRVFDIGPGAGFLLYILKTERGCDVSGLDRPFPFFSACRSLLDIESTIAIERIHRFRPIHCLNGPYDYILALGACFDCSLLERIWVEDAYTYWFQQIDQHLRPGGQLIADFNSPPIRPFVAKLPVVMLDDQRFTYTKPVPQHP